MESIHLFVNIVAVAVLIVASLVSARTFRAHWNYHGSLQHKLEMGRIHRTFNWWTPGAIAFIAAAWLFASNYTP